MPRRCTPGCVLQHRGARASRFRSGPRARRACCWRQAAPRRLHGQAALVRDTGEPLSRTVPATIAGERRMVRVVEVPLGESGVAGYAVDVEDREQARADLTRFVRAQRDLLDRLSEGVAQFA